MTTWRTGLRKFRATLCALVALLAFLGVASLPGTAAAVAPLPGVGPKI